MVYGYVPSKIDGTEDKFKVAANLPLPEEYSYKQFLSPVLNQGAESICVPCSVSAHLNWNKNVDTKAANNTDNNVDLHEIYSIRTNNGEGMTFKEAFKYLRHHGVKSKAGSMKIRRYAMVGSALGLKQALIMNGPCVGAFYVYNTGSKFWKKEYGDSFLGGHAISIVGWTKEGFIIRNSWGSSWGDKGYTILPYTEFSNLLEIWTIMD